MGSAIVSSVAPDTTLAMLAAHHLGIEPSRILASVMSQFKDGLMHGDKETKAMIAQMGLVAHASIDHALNVSKYEGGTKVVEALSKVSNFVIKAQGLHAWDEALKRAFTMEFHGFVGRNIDKGFDELSAPLRAFFDENGFGRQEWDGIRSGNSIDVDGAKFFDPSSIADRDLQMRFKSAFYDAMRTATPTPGILERSLQANMKRSTFTGELMRSGMMYKSFPLWMMFTHLARGARMAEGGKGGYMATMLIGATMAGMASLQAKQLLKGNDPLNMSRVDTWMQAAAMGGGVGIFGDFINNSFSRSGTDIAGTLGGPAVQFAQGITTLGPQSVRKLVADEKNNWQQGLVQQIKNWTPGSSLWYTRLASDRLVYDQLQKMIDPNYRQAFQRVNDKMMKDMGQQAWWKKGEVAPDRGPNLGAAFGQ